jgi:ribosome-binding ATPase
MKIGIVGMPNAGKSSLFNALTRAGAAAANYPFTTVEPNVAVVGVPDDRLEQVAATVRAPSIVHETIQFHDIAGLVRGAHQGEGLGNKFLANIRETDAILHVVRAHDDPQVVHPEGRVDPLADVETIETELLFADLEQAERRLERVSKQAKSLDKVAVAEERWLREVVEALGEGRAVRTVPQPADAPGASSRLAALTSKPVLYVANVAEGEPLEPPPELLAHAEERGARATAVSARLDAELSELDDEEADVMRDELGVAESGLETVIREAFALLHLVQFFTGGQEKEARAWAIPQGTRARRAAGAVHTDMERGFVAAEVTPWNALVDAGGYAPARERALTRVEGRDYVVQDGDVVTFRFTPS